jgi:hypothetical protein
MALADDTQFDQSRPFGRKVAQVRYQGVIAREARKVDARHGGRSLRFEHGSQSSVDSSLLELSTSF